MIETYVPCWNADWIFFSKIIKGRFLGYSNVHTNDVMCRNIEPEVYTYLCVWPDGKCIHGLRNWLCSPGWKLSVQWAHCLVRPPSKPTWTMVPWLVLLPRRNGRVRRRLAGSKGIVYTTSQKCCWSSPTMRPRRTTMRRTNYARSIPTAVAGNRCWRRSVSSSRTMTSSSGVALLLSARNPRVVFTRRTEADLSLLLCCVVYLLRFCT